MYESKIQLSSLCMKRHLSQQEVASRVEVRRATISDLECGSGKSQGIEFDPLARLCKVPEVQPNGILGLVGIDGVGGGCALN